ncbi:MAG: hypothetical protein BSOLF_1002 [Candidatus Carbobacillus altaicus]|uniref:Uncharacterized protein n=1 Tax=Candidatus Carbonibacillus altaicus TaxID=2163959 RepID=A0A2R6Y034_9BACL|nr:MAG: hypothetical protein BSOLF_1002 [Candidatus Carbobacillus altaicus]
MIPFRHKRCTYENDEEGFDMTAVLYAHGRKLRAEKRRPAKESGAV